jgi:lipid-binding SYLF domain-containing protein
VKAGDHEFTHARKEEDMNRHGYARALALMMSMTSAACATNTPSTEADAQKAQEALGHAVTELDDATAIVREMTQTGEHAIPPDQRRRAKCVAIITNLTSGGLILGGQFGDGVVACRTAHGWSGPVFIKMGGGSAGLQAGVQQSDLVMLVMTDGTRLFRKDFQLGADASVAAGPTGVGTMASTDARMKAEILTYARSRGLFAGIELSGVGLKQNLNMANAVYGTDVDSAAILGGEVAPPKEAAAFLHQLRLSFPE